VSSVVETYLERMVAHDFEAMAACLADDVVRVGPYGDTYTPRDPYVAMLSELMPSLPGYSMEISRVAVLEPDRLVLVELSETVEIDGAPLVTPEALVFELNADGLISHIRIYIQTWPRPSVPPASI
jgi:ketosteroid isomerase-like protein